MDDLSELKVIHLRPVPIGLEVAVRELGDPAISAKARSEFMALLEPNRGTSKSGPAMVSSNAFRNGWEATFANSPHRKGESN